MMPDARDERGRYLAVQMVDLMGEYAAQRGDRQKLYDIGRELQDHMDAQQAEIERKDERIAELERTGAHCEKAIERRRCSLSL